jgi:hypothetical protein
MKAQNLRILLFLIFCTPFFDFQSAHAQEVRKLTGKKWKFDILEIVKEIDFSMTVLDSLTTQATDNEKVVLRNLKNGIESMLKFIPNIGSTTFEFKRKGDLIVTWEGKQISKGKWRMIGRQLSMQLGEDEDVIKITQLTDNRLVATTENDSSLRLISLE